MNLRISLQVIIMTGDEVEALEEGDFVDLYSKPVKTGIFYQVETIIPWDDNITVVTSGGLEYFVKSSMSKIDLLIQESRVPSLN